MQSVVIDAREVQDWSAEGLAAVQAFIAWLERIKSDDVTVAIDSMPPRGRAPFDHRFTFPQLSPDLLKKWRPYRDVAIEVEVQRSSDSPVNTRELIETSSEQILALLQASFETGFADYTVSQVVADFLQEGLLNVAEHAEPASPSAHERAWVSARMYESASDVFDVLGDEHEPEGIRNWLSAVTSHGSSRLLEIAVVDTGIGIASSLAKACLKNRPELKFGGQGIAAWTPIHDAVLEWAFSAFGTRKDIYDFSDQAFAQAWRGIYRVHFQASAIGGLLMLRSGMGMYGRGAVAGRTFSISMGHALASSDRRVMPWTSLRLLLPIPLVRTPITDQEAEQVSIARVEVVPFDIRTITSELELSGNHQEAISQYGRAVRETVARAVTAAERDLKNSAGTPYVAVVHPLKSMNATVPDAWASPGASVDQHVADSMVQILIDAALPGVVPIHIGFDINSATVKEIQMRFAVRPKAYPIPRHTQLCGVLSLRTGELSWLLFKNDWQEAASLVIDGSIAEAGGQPPDWWQDLINLYPGAFDVESDEEAGEVRLFRTLPQSVATTSLVEIVRYLRPALHEWAVKEKKRWWASLRGDGEFLRTATSAIVTEFLSVNALCADEPEFERLLGLTVRQLLADFKHGGRWLVVPVSETASFLLAKRLLYNTERVKVSHPDQVLENFNAGDAICIFADSVFESVRLRRRAAAIAGILKAASIKTTIVAFDLRPADFGPLGSNTVTLVRWPLNPPIDPKSLPPNVDPLDVDEVTNEISTREAIEEARRFGSLAASDVSLEALESLISDENLLYGIQWIVSDRLHMVRCSTQKLFDDADWRARIAGELVKRVGAQAKDGAADLVFVTRDESTIRKWLNDIARMVGRELRASANWTGKTFAGVLETTRRAGHQIMLRQFDSATRAAIRVDESRRDSREQRHLFVADRVADGFVCIYLDNTAVTGRSISDVAVAVARAKSPKPSTLLAFVAIDKLAPSAERLLVSATALHRSNGHGSMPFEFGALLQLRVPHYDTFETTPLFGYLTRLEAAAKNLPTNKPLAIELKQIIDRISNARDEMVLQFPMGPIESAPIQVSLGVVKLRQLMTVHQDGAPVISLLLPELHKLLGAKDDGLLILFALEPTLLDDGLIRRAVAEELMDLILATLAESPSIALRRNAVMVAIQLGEVFIDQVSAVAKLALQSEDIAPYFVVLLAEYLNRVRDVDIAGRIIPAVQLVSASFLSPQVDTHLSMIEAAALAMAAKRPQNEEQAQTALTQLLQKARGHHSLEGFGAWWELNTTFSSGTDGKDPEVLRIAGLDSLWDAAESFLKADLISAMHALAMLTVGVPGVGMQGIERLTITALTSFEEARRIAKALSHGTQSIGNMTAAWNHVREATFSSAVDLLYVNNRAAVVGESVQTSRSGLSILDHALPFVVQEPIGLLLHTIGAVFGDSATIQLSVHGNINYSKYADVRTHLQWLRVHWEGNSTLALVLKNGHLLRRSYWILARNIYKHGSRKPELFADIDIQKSQVTLSLENEIRLPKSEPGHGHGHRQVERYMRSMKGTRSGDFGHMEPGSTYRGTLFIPTDLVWLPERGRQ